MSEEHKADEIEITPEMMEAGCEVLSMYSPSEDSASEWAGEIYIAMEKARLARVKVSE